MEKFFWQNVPRNAKIKPEFIQNRSELRDRIDSIYVQTFGNEGFKTNKNLWFRGSIDLGHRLIPSLYRDKQLKECTSFHEQLDEIPKFFDNQLNLFQTRVQSRLHHIFENHSSIPALESVFNWTSLMQHYSAPSWFLDWSLDLDVSIFFAIEHLYNENMNLLNVNIEPCIWILNPYKMNQYFWPESQNKKIPSNLWIDNIISSEILNSRIPTFFDLEKKKETNIWMKRRGRVGKNAEIIEQYQIKATSRPLNLYPLQNTNRISTQKGMFTAFPINQYSSENTGSYKPYEFFFPLDSYNNSEQFLWCIQLKDFENLKEDLQRRNFSPWDVYPEIGYKPGIRYS